MRHSCVVLLAALACGRSDVYGGPEAVAVLVPRGLHTYENPLSGDIPAGALAVAQNVVSRRPGVVEPRRGLNPLAGTFPSSGTADAVTFWTDSVAGKTWMVAHTSANKIAYVDTASPGGAWTELSGTFAPPTGQTMRFVEANKNLYFTTSAGLYKVDTVANGAIAAGGVKGTTITAALTTGAATTGFLAANAEVGYRVLWGVRDANGNVISGVPTQRLVQLGNSDLQTVSSGNLSRTATTVTVTLSTHGYSTNDVLWLFSTDANFPPGAKVITKTGANTFTYPEAGAATTSSAATTVTYATKNVTLTVAIPTGVTTAYFAQVYRTAQTVDVSVDPGDEESLVYEYTPLTTEVAAAAFSFTDIAVDSLRGATIYTAPSQGGILLGNEVPPICNDVATFKESVFSACYSTRQRIQISLLAVGGSLGMQNADGFILAFASNSSWTMTAGSSENTSGTFQRYTSGTASQNIANTAQSIVRTINKHSSNTQVFAYYLSGPEDPPGLIGIEARTLSLPTFAVTSDTANVTRQYFAPPLTGLLVSSAGQISRTSGVVTVNTTTIHNLTVGQQVFLVTSADATNFPTGVKTVATTATTSRFTYLEAGANGATSGFDTAFEANQRDISSTSSATNGLSFSPRNEPESFPLEFTLATNKATSSILRIIALRERLFVFDDAEGLFAVSGTDPSSFRIDIIDPTVKLLAPNSVAALNNQIYALTNQGVVRVSEFGGVEVLSLPIEGDLTTLLAGNLAQVKLLATATAYESERSYLLWLPTTGDYTKNGQAYVYNYGTETWVLWTMGAKAAAVSPVDNRLYLADNTLSTLRQERKTLDYTDFADGTVAVTISSSTGTSVVLSSATGVNVGDLLTQGSLKSTVTAVNSNTLTVADSLAWSNASATVYSAFTSVVQFLPEVFAQLGGIERSKDVTRATWYFGDARWTGATVDYATDTSPTFESASSVSGTDVIGGTAYERAFSSSIPLEKHQCAQFKARFSITNAQASWQLRALSLAAVKGGEVVR